MMMVVSDPDRRNLWWNWVFDMFWKKIKNMVNFWIKCISFKKIFFFINKIKSKINTVLKAWNLSQLQPAVRELRSHEDSHLSDISLGYLSLRLVLQNKQKQKPNTNYNFFKTTKAQSFAQIIKKIVIILCLKKVCIIPCQRHNLIVFCTIHFSSNSTRWKQCCFGQIL